MTITPLLVSSDMERLIIISSEHIIHTKYNVIFTENFTQYQLI